MKKAEAQCVIPKLVTRWDVRETAVGAFGVKTHNRCFFVRLFGIGNIKIKMQAAIFTKSNCNFDPSASCKIGLWCNGSTTDFGSVGQGSNPCSPTVAHTKKT